ncbi:TAXI family TRAP transporter solute-binding subunit [Candidimonas sp. SYP-B2681]|uniref:TAXI family TRAP transporter solute-binding subunit n=1 Tax=Candidimonas sp. SYP-B2681 TaxID=2497686 RepID=UPI000F86F30F|nr:TAXI family TRAP transporter solute-binding subunit [Candidimonas sp. SYP-B2681]RTZ45771.1 TAXI family TRAP transporter solute-binding subunit [Candidimonas sp. SYP-B2681]
MRSIFACLFLIFLSACSLGPDTDALRTDIEQRLEFALSKDVVELVSLERRGSQKDTRAPAAEDQRIIYFDAALKLKRDIDFSAWNAPGVAGLVSSLGAGPKGMSGITSGGNKAGDVITAHGTALYRRDGQRWVTVAPAGYQPPVAPGFATGSAEGIGAILAALRKVVDAFPRDSSPAQHAAIQEELATAQDNIQARLVRLANGYAIAAGAEHGQYLRVAKALFTERNSRGVPLITRGGEENLQLLRSGKVSLALAQGDAALDAYEGTGAFEGQGPHSVLRAIASLYPEPVHVLVRGDDTRASIADLRSSRVAIGEIGSASRTTALRVLEAHGLTLDDISAQELGLGAALLALQRNEVDAVFQVIGTPADSIRASLTSMPLRLLPLSTEAVSKLADEKRGYFPYVITKGTYPGQEHDIQTIGTAALLLTDATLSDAEVGALTRDIFEQGHDYSVLGSAQAAQISLATSRQGVSVPMHGAAIEALDRMSLPASVVDPGPTSTK